jgi:hypothetical protein
MILKPIINNPNASVLVNSMRSIGYEFEQAIADILDNSISANCKKIDIIFPVDENERPFLLIFDDGDGMNRVELQEAMRFGSIKDTQRSKHDLGRFGLGLKTASLSQCRKFSCISKKDNEINGFYWDIDLLLDDKWKMYNLTDEQIHSIEGIEQYINKPSFTLVVWENFDVFDKDINTNRSLSSVFFSNLEKAKNHLSLVFHRYLEENLIISFNGGYLKPKDPFLRNHKLTLQKQKQKIATKTKTLNEESVEFQVFVLPYHKDLSNEDYELIGGIDQIDNQGFYVYRNKRLMNFGSWYRLKPKNALFENARILVDIPNTLDDLWSIDIKKQKAIIPATLLEQLSREVDDVSVQSKRIHKYKGDIQTTTSSVWNKLVDERLKSVSYLINFESFPVKSILDSIEDLKTYEKIKKLMELIQSSIPYKDIYNSVAEKKDVNKLDLEQINNFVEQALIMFENSKKNSKITSEQFLQTISKVEPFSNKEILDVIKGKLE